MEYLMQVVVPVITIVIVLLIVVGVLLRSYRVAAPDEALIITGRNAKNSGDIDLESGGSRRADTSRRDEPGSTETPLAPR